MLLSTFRPPVHKIFTNICRLNIENQFLKNMSKTGQWTRNYRMLCRKDVIRCVPGTAIQRFCTIQAATPPPSVKEPDLPKMEYVTYLDASLFRRSNFRPIKHNDYEFTECINGYTQVFVKTVGDRRDPLSDPNSLYACAVYFGPSNPLNVATSIKHNLDGDLIAAKQAIEILLQIGIKKICINTTQKDVISKIRRLDVLKEAHYIKSQSGALYKYRENLQQLDKLLRDNNSLEIMWKYAPEKCQINGVNFASDLAKTKLDFKTKLNKRI